MLSFKSLQKGFEGGHFNSPALAEDSPNQHESKSAPRREESNVEVKAWENLLSEVVAVSVVVVLELENILPDGP